MSDEAIQSKVKDFINSLAEIEIELTTMKRRIEDVKDKDKVERVKTKADAEAFDEWYANHLLDDGLNCVELKTWEF